MKRLINFIILLSVFISVIFPQKTVAVLDFDVNNVSKSDVRALCDRLREELFRTKKYRVLERGLMEEIMKEQKFQLSGCVSTECIVEVGQLTGVQKMVGGSVSKVGSVYSVSSRIIDVETGEISKMSSYDHIGDMGELLTKGMRFVAIELTKERKSQSLIPQGSGVGISDIKSSPSGESIEIDEIPIDEIKPATQKNITEEKPQVIVKRESDISLNKGGGDDYQKYISDKTWSIGGGISTSRSFNVMQISKDYKIGTNFSLFIFAGFPWVGIGLSLQSNYNDNGLILGSSIGQNLLWDKIDDSMDIMTSSFLNNYLGYQWRTGKENYITFGGVICTSISPKEEQSDVIGDSRWWEFWVPIISFDRRF